MIDNRTTRAIQHQYQLFPELPAEEYEELKADIAKHGVLVPVEKDEYGNILDGYHRERACKELGITDYPVTTRYDLTHEQKIEHVLTLNLLRRHLTREQRREVVIRLRGEGWPNTRIAETLQVDEKTVRNDLKPVSEYSDTELPGTIIRSDGKPYPAHRPLSVITTTANEAKKVQDLLQRGGLPDMENTLVTGTDFFKAAKIARRKQSWDKRMEAVALSSMGRFPVLLADLTQGRIFYLG